MTGQAFGEPYIYVVEDDIDVRRALSLILARAGYHVSCFADGLSLMDALHAKSAACILLDICLPGPSGIDILERLKDKGVVAPVVIVSGNQDIKTAVDAIKLGAVDYIEKPFSGEDVLARVEAAIRASSDPKQAHTIPSTFPGSGSLTRREREVLEHTASGQSAKQIAISLGLSPRTIEDHRANLLRKVGARNAAELILRVMSGWSRTDGHAEDHLGRKDNAG
ncbi:response regulator [Bradyrhizobium sp.]|uniref:response regulator transcription factor n=1 Tax=Bradyrhizobium sp. TaxID=376 RepID=UPI002608F829|nr:response regulator [Bradyrhizobium sp.]